LSADVGILGDTTNFVDLGGGGGYVSRDAVSPPAAHPFYSHGQNAWHDQTYDELEQGVDSFASNHHRLSGEIQHDESFRCRREMVRPDADVQMGQVWKILFKDSEAMISKLKGKIAEDCDKIQEFCRGATEKAQNTSVAHILKRPLCRNFV
jgi:hypothetical protein